MHQEQNLCRENKIINPPVGVVDAFKGVSFKKDAYLERDPNSSAQKCLEDFYKKGGSVQCISNLIDGTAPKVRFNLGDAVYPICSGGFCRSQALWAILKPFSDQIILFPPHAARLGWDPYNGQINRFKNYAQEKVPDTFNAYFGIGKAQRFALKITQNGNLLNIHRLVKD